MSPDRPERLVPCERHLLGPQLAEATDPAGRQAAAAASQPALDPADRG